MTQPTIKLSEAMREGAKQHPQTHGHFFETDDENKVIATCALGAAFIGIGGDPAALQSPDEVVTTLSERCNVDFHSEINDDYARKGHRTLLWATIGRNDRGNGMPREAIADWLDANGY